MDRDFRALLLAFAKVAPDPAGFKTSLPGYLNQWVTVHAVLRETCPDHCLVDGHCPNCHDNA